MHTTRHTPESFHDIFDAAAPHIFATAAFNTLNIAKVSDMLPLVVEDDDHSPVAGIIIGVDADGVCRAPFSAPFNSVTYLRDADIGRRIQVHRALTDYIDTNIGGPTLLFTPPQVYDDGSQAIEAAALQTCGYRPLYADINYSYRIDSSRSAAGRFGKRARRYLRALLGSGMTFHTAVDPGEAYAVIAANRRAKGYPLRMSLDDVLRTIRIVEADFFMLRSAAGTPLAAAMTYRVAPGIVQVIYWGDIPGAAGGDHCMLRLAAEIFDHYAALGMTVVDVGPSSQEGVASPGLCRFKSLIGCEATMKVRWTRPAIHGSDR